MVMLEDQSEERACLYALGLLDATEARAFEADAAGSDSLRRTAAELQDILANLSLSVTSIQRPADHVRERLLSRIETQPARVTTDREGRIETINPAFTRLCGYRFEELRGRKPGHLLQGPATDPASVETLRQAVRAGVGCEVEMINYHRDGSPYRVHIVVEPRRDETTGEVIGFRATERELAPA